MRRYFAFISLIIFLATGCAPFIRDESVPKLLELEGQIYRTKKKIDLTGSGYPFQDIEIPDGMDVRLVVALGTDWVKIYGYPYSGEDSRLREPRYLILYMFEDDFPDKKFDPEYLKKRLYSLVEIKEQSGPAIIETKKTRIR